MCRASSALPETAAPAPGAFVAAFRRLAEDGADGVVCLNLSSKLSATIESARAAAREVADLIAVRVVDTLSVSCGHGAPGHRSGPDGRRRQVARRGGGCGRGGDAPCPGLRRPGHPGKPEEGRPDRRGDGPGRFDAVDQAGDRGRRRGRRTGIQATYEKPIAAVPVPTRSPRPTPSTRSISWPSGHGDASDIDAFVSPGHRGGAGRTGARWLGRCRHRISRRTRGHRSRLVVSGGLIARTGRPAPKPGRGTGSLGLRGCP